MLRAQWAAPWALGTGDDAGQARELHEAKEAKALLVPSV